MEALRPWGRDGASPVIELDFEHDGTPGRLVKTFAGAKGQAHLTFGDETIDDPAAVDRRLAELTGLPSEKFFRSTASVHHYELENLDRDEAALRDRLQASMSGADRGTSAARKKLQEALRRLTTEGPRNPGTLKQDRERVAELTAAAQQGEAGLAALERDQAALSTARDAHGAAVARVAEARELLGRAEHAATLLARQHDAEARYQRYKRATELRDQILAQEARPSGVDAAAHAARGDRAAAPAGGHGLHAAGRAGRRARTSPRTTSATCPRRAGAASPSRGSPWC